MNTFADAVGLLEEVVVVALAASIEKVFAFSSLLVVVPAWEGSLTGSNNWSRSTWVYRQRDRQDQLFVLKT